MARDSQFYLTGSWNPPIRRLGRHVSLKCLAVIIKDDPFRFLRLTKITLHIQSTVSQLFVVRLAWWHRNWTDKSTLQVSFWDQTLYLEPCLKWLVWISLLLPWAVWVSSKKNSVPTSHSAAGIRTTAQHITRRLQLLLKTPADGCTFISSRVTRKRLFPWAKCCLLSFVLVFRRKSCSLMIKQPCQSFGDTKASPHLCLLLGLLMAAWFRHK